MSPSLTVIKICICAITENVIIKTSNLHVAVGTSSETSQLRSHGLSKTRACRTHYKFELVSWLDFYVLK